MIGTFAVKLAAFFSTVRVTAFYLTIHRPGDGLLSAFHRWCDRSPCCQTNGLLFYRPGDGLLFHHSPSGFRLDFGMLDDDIGHLDLSMPVSEVSACKRRQESG
ncbi:hypothetical protein Taro_017014 [Colocasia esculenta]|uniref:Secreted protein n=1 Tax=Colocasia esculenta TaxID=4460 RepID=A0A843UUQ1_COLES|nr:hypothetical protein [Colocasia esculenta]